MKPVQKIGHRGAKGHCAENTLESAEVALGFGVDAVEVDVHRCKTGELVVIHDFTLDRTTNGSGKVKDFSLITLKKLLIEDKYRIPMLVELLDLISGKCSINIELKGEGTAGETCRLIRHYVENLGWKYEDFLVSGFQKNELFNVYATNPEIPLAVLTETSLKEAIEVGRQIKAVAINPASELVSEENIRILKKEGVRVNVWTVNEPEEISRVKELGVDGIISDFPDRL